MNRSICIHGHFYQPPRENPWLEEIELQDSAYPYHDWNERITAECYAPNTASRILNPDKRIIDIVSNYSRISFNFGPTLLSWILRYAPEVYQMIIEADRESQKRFSGHGSALAQVYNHMIMPLANTRDKYTQIFWGLKDFEHRFQRKPEGMWLSETAVDLETLDIMAEQGIKFTILAPRQAKKVRGMGDREWKDVSGEKIDPRRSYLYRLPSGRTISLFFYDGPVSRDIAFGNLLSNGEVFAKRLLNAFFQDKNDSQLVHIATDGESYGHHHRFGDMALAYALHYIESNNLAKLTNYGEYLEKVPPKHEVEIFENTSWSCAHGVERWRNNCGCNTGGHAGWTQAWRPPLRESMDWLRDRLIPVYEKGIISYVKDPWQARDDYIDIILDRSVQNRESFFAKHAAHNLTEEEKVKALKLLEMQRHAMLMYTSCGWFFDDISGIETLQIMGYASRAMQLAHEINGVSLEPDFIKMLEQAPSNVPDHKNGGRLYETFVKPSAMDLLKVSAHYAISSLFEDYPETTKIFCYTATREIYDFEEVGTQKFAIGKVRLHSDITGEESITCFAVFHFGDHNVIGGISEDKKDDSFSLMHKELKDAFLQSDISEAIRLMEKHFVKHSYSLWHLFKEEKRKILNQILAPTMQEIENSYRQIYEQHYSIMQVMKEKRIPLPKAITAAMEFIINTDLQRLLENEKVNLKRLQELARETKKWSFELDKTTLGFVASKRINRFMEDLSEAPEGISLLKTLESVFRILGELSLKLDLWKAQNIYFSIDKQLSAVMRERSERGDQGAQEWTEYFDKLGEYLQIGIE